MRKVLIIIIISLLSAYVSAQNIFRTTCQGNLSRLDAIEIKYALDNKNFTLMRLAYFPDNIPVMVGLTAASPDGDGFKALFEDFEIIHLPDARRKKWLESN